MSVHEPLTAKPATSNATKCYIAGSLALIAGYVDVICFIRYSTFVATMTGNLVMTGQTFFEVVHNVVGIKDLKKPTPGIVSQHLDIYEAVYMVTFRLAVMFFNCLGAFCHEFWQRRHPDATARTAAPYLAALAVVPDLARRHGLNTATDKLHETWVQMWAVMPLAFSLGFTHFLCSPAATGSRLKNVVMASTGHMHKVSKLLHRRACGDQLKPSEWEAMILSTTISVCMLVGAVLGGAALHLNPFGEDTDDGLLVPVGMVLLCSLWAHDKWIAPP